MVTPLFHPCLGCFCLSEAGVHMPRACSLKVASLAVAQLSFPDNKISIDLRRHKVCTEIVPGQNILLFLIEMRPLPQECQAQLSYQLPVPSLLGSGQECMWDRNQEAGADTEGCHRGMAAQTWARQNLVLSDPCFGRHSNGVRLWRITKSCHQSPWSLNI